MTVGERIRDARKRAGLSQAELGAKLGMSQSAISSAERGGYAVSVEWLTRLGHTLNFGPGGTDEVMTFLFAERPASTDQAQVNQELTEH